MGMPLLRNRRSLFLGHTTIQCNMVGHKRSQVPHGRLTIKFVLTTRKSVSRSYSIQLGVWNTPFVYTFFFHLSYSIHRISFQFLSARKSLHLTSISWWLNQIHEQANLTYIMRWYRMMQIWESVLYSTIHIRKKECLEIWWSQQDIIPKDF